MQELVGEVKNWCVVQKVQVLPVRPWPATQEVHLVARSTQLAQGDWQMPQGRYWSMKYSPIGLQVAQPLMLRP